MRKCEWCEKEFGEEVNEHIDAAVREYVGEKLNGEQTGPFVILCSPECAEEWFAYMDELGEHLEEVLPENERTIN